MALNKLLDSIEVIDLQALVDNQVPEGKTIDYKEALPGNADGDKKEFLADVSSFANAAGGNLIFGMKEDAGIPVDLCGLQVSNVDNEILRLENIIQTGLAPRLPGVQIRSIPLSSKPQPCVVIIIHIRKSWTSPHMITFKNDSKFYTRNSRGKYQLDVLELRAAFVLSETTAERIRNFRTERLSSIITGTMPVKLGEKAPKLVLHIVPFDALGPATRFDVNTLDSQGVLFEPFASSPREFSSLFQKRGALDNQYNFDGLLISRFFPDWKSPTSYVQIFRDGSVEAVDISILTDSGDRRSIPGTDFERRLLLALKRYLEAQKKLGVEPPLFVMLSLLGVEGYIIEHHSLSEPSGQIDRPDLVIPEIMVEHFDVDVTKVMKPIFDTIWNASGWRRSMAYDESGKSLLTNLP